MEKTVEELRDGVVGWVFEMIYIMTPRPLANL
jgi:hypothetical protein